MKNPITCLLLINVKISEQFFNSIRMKCSNLEGSWLGANAPQLFIETRILL